MEEAKRQRIDDLQARKVQLAAAKALAQQRGLCTRTVLKLAPVQASIAALTAEHAYKKAPVEARARLDKVWANVAKLKDDAEASQIAPAPTFNVALDAIATVVLDALAAMNAVKVMMPQLRKMP